MDWNEHKQYNLVLNVPFHQHFAPGLNLATGKSRVA